MKKNDTVKIEITDISSSGHGVGRVDGIVVFIPGAAIGDVLNVLIVKVQKSFCYGKIVECFTLSADRIDVDCPVFGKCGGCVFRHISYESELKFKHKRVCDAMKKISGFDVFVDDVVRAKSINRYRNKAQYPVNADGIGFYAPGSHRVIPCVDCLLEPAEFRDIVNVFTKTNMPPYDEASHTGMLRHVFIRKAAATGEIMVCPVINGEKLPDEKQLVNDLLELKNINIKSVVLGINRKKTNVILGDKYRNLHGDGYITDIICGKKIRLSPVSFYQVNRDMAEVLYGIAADFAVSDANRLLLDIYCGAGTIGLSLAHLFETVIGIEIVENAVNDAIYNAKQNGVSNISFLRGDAKKAAKKLAAEGKSPDTVVVDPPRKGCEAGLISIITDELKPERILYISCDPSTLARDLKQFVSSGYRFVKATPVDMFPRTPHVETIVLLQRQK